MLQLAALMHPVWGQEPSRKYYEFHKIKKAQMNIDYSYDYLSQLVEPKPVARNFLNHWVSPKFHQNGEYSIHALKRYTAIGGTTFPIANFNIYTFPKLKNDKPWNTEEIMDYIELGFDKKWKRKVGKIHSSLEGYWAGGNRYMRYSFHEKSDSIIMTIYSGRVGYWDSTYPEALTLEKHLKINQIQEKKTSSFLPVWLIPRAHAQSIFGNLFGGSGSTTAGNSSVTPPGLSTGSSPLAGIDELNNSLQEFNKDFDALSIQLDSLNSNIETGNNNWATTNVQIGNANQNWSDTNGQIGAANQNWADTNTQIGTANQNWGDTNTQIDVANQNWQESNKQVEELGKKIDQGIQDANQNWDETNQIIDKNWNNSNKELARANDLAAKALDPKHMFTLAAATSAGAVLGATLAQTAIDLMVMGAGAIYEAITGAKADAQRWAKFKEARGAWEKNLETATQLEKLLDNFLLSHEMMKNLKNSLTDEQKSKLSREEMVKVLSINTRILKKKLKKKEENFFETESPQCEAQIALEMEDLEAQIKKQMGLKEILDNSYFNIYDDEYFCEELPRIFGKLAEAEAMLAQYRLDILSARSQWAEFENERLEEMAKQMERLNKGNEDKEFTNNLIDNAEDAHKLYVDLLDDSKDTWVNECKKIADQVTGKKYEQRFKICSEKYNNPELNAICAKTLVIDRYQHDKSFHEINQEKRDACKRAYESSYLGRTYDLNKANSKSAMQRKIAGYEQNRGRNRSNYLMNLDVENQRLSSFQRFFDDIYEQQYCFENPNDQECQEKSKVKFMGPFYVKDRAKVKLKEICGLDDFY